METIKIDLKRKKLSDNFKACNQEINCQCAFNDYMLKAIEARVDELCMSLECFLYLLLLIFIQKFIFVIQ